MRVSRSLAVAALATSASALVAPRAPRPAPAPLDIDAKADVSDAPFILQTRTKSGGGYSGLYVYAYHTGAGLNDAMLDTQKAVANQGTAFTGGVAGKSPYFVVLFELGGSPYELTPSTGSTPYPGLLPVRINVNQVGPSVENAFYFDDDSLKWTNSANSSHHGGFDSWLGTFSLSPFSFDIHTHLLTNQSLHVTPWFSRGPNRTGRPAVLPLHARFGTEWML